MTLYSVVIPVFNSQDTITQVCRDVLDTATKLDIAIEIVLVNDGSRDNSWKLISDLASQHREVVAIDLLRNYGQHSANLCGLRHSTGDWIFTIDDDGQNPPTEFAKFIEAANRGGHDVVFGRFVQKQASTTRKLGTRIIDRINTTVFAKPPDLAVSNYRMISRQVADRITQDQNTFPYITGQALLYASRPGNVDVIHQQRQAGTSNYTASKIVRLVAAILFSYSPAPLYLMAFVGGGVALLSFVLAAAYFVVGLVGASDTAGWPSLIVLLSLLNGVIIMMLGMIGAIQMRILTQLNGQNRVIVAEVTGRDN